MMRFFPAVMLVSGISDAEMQWCYRNCDLLLAPSTIEGFGLPVAEALLAGCRIVCSDIPPFVKWAGSIAAMWGLVHAARDFASNRRVCGIDDHRPFRSRSFLLGRCRSVYTAISGPPAAPIFRPISIPALPVVG